MINGVGDKVAKSIIEFFKDKKNVLYIAKLLKNGVAIGRQKVEKREHGKLAGQTFVLTGTLDSMSRDEAREKIKTLGGEVSGSVSKNTSAVVAGAEPGGKYINAKKLGVKILAEKEFLEMIKE